MSAGHGPCPICMTLVTDLWPHHTRKFLVTQCGHPVEEIPRTERAGDGWELKEYRFS
jgi:hypothetical protein